jgi:hypothetical protein
MGVEHGFKGFLQILKCSTVVGPAVPTTYRGRIAWQSCEKAWSPQTSALLLGDDELQSRNHEDNGQQALKR